MSTNMKMKPTTQKTPAPDASKNLPTLGYKSPAVVRRGRQSSRNTSTKAHNIELQSPHTAAQRLTLPEVLVRIPITPELDDEIVRELLCMQIDNIYDLWRCHLWCNRVRELGGAELAETEVWAIRTGSKAMTAAVREGVAIFQKASRSR